MTDTDDRRRNAEEARLGLDGTNAAACAWLLRRLAGTTEPVDADRCPECGGEGIDGCGADWHDTAGVSR